jgi:hypothetical protein
MSEPGAAERVEACRRYLRRRGGAALVLLAVGAAGVVLPLSWLVAGPGGWRPGSGLPLAVLVVGLAATALALGWGWPRLREHLAAGTLVERIERAAGLPRGRLLAQLELESTPVDGVSAELVHAGQAGIRGALDRPAAELSGDGRVETGRLLRTSALVAGSVALVTLVLLAAAPDRAELAWAGLARPMTVLHPAALPPLAVSPGDARVPRGQGVEVTVEAPGRGEIRLRFDAPGEPTRTLLLPVVDGRAVGELPPVEGPTRYRALADDGSESPDYLLEPEDPLLLEAFSLQLLYPGYTGLPPETLALPPASLRVPAGTAIVVSGRLAGSAAAGPEGVVLELRAAPARNGGGEAPLLTFDLGGTGDAGGAGGGGPRDPAFEGRWQPRASQTVTWAARGDLPAGFRLPGPMEVEVLPDLPPAVRLSDRLPGRPPGAEAAELPASMRLPLLIEAEDDWGLAWVELEVRVFPAGAPVRQLADRTPADGIRRILVEPVLDLASWGLEPGTRVRLQARAADQGTGPGVGVSEALEFTVPTPAALRQEAREQIRTTAESTASLAERAREELERVEMRLRDQVASGEARSDAGAGAPPDPAGGAGDTGARDPAAGAEARDALAEALEGEARLLRELESLREALGRSSDALGQGPEERELRRTLADLEDRLAAMAGEEAREAAEARLRELEAGERAGETAGEEARAPSAADVAEALEASAERQDALTQRLNDLLQRLEAAALTADIEAAREDASLLAEAQEALARAGEDGGPEDQEALADRARELEARAEALEAQLRERGDAAAGTMREAAQALEQAAAAMERAAAADGGAGSAEATEAAAEAARAAEEAMNEAAAAAREARGREIAALLTGAAMHALALADALAEAPAEPRAEPRAAGQAPGAPETLALPPAPRGAAPLPDPLAPVLAVRDGTRNLALALGDGLLDAGELARELSIRTGAALQAVDRMVEPARRLGADLAAGAAPGAPAGASAGAPAGAGPGARWDPSLARLAEQARSALHALALAALEALERQASGESGEGGEGGGPSQELMDALEALAQAQSQLNEEAAEIGSDGSRTQPGPDSQERMEELAAAQDAVAASLGELGEASGGERIAGSLEELGREAEELARELAAAAAEGRPSAETLARQERLLERLLQAGRTMERDEPTEERRGTPAGWVERPRIPALPPGLLEGSRVLLPSPESLARLSPAERRLVLEYFSRLGPGGTAPGGPP